MNKRTADYQDPYFKNVFKDSYYTLKNDHSGLFKKISNVDVLKNIHEIMIDGRHFKNSDEVVGELGDYILVNDEFFQLLYGEDYTQFKRKLEDKGINYPYILACAIMKEMQINKILNKTIIEEKEKFVS